MSAQFDAAMMSLAVARLVPLRGNVGFMDAQCVRLAGDYGFDVVALRAALDARLQQIKAEASAIEALPREWEVKAAEKDFESGEAA